MDNRHKKLRFHELLEMQFHSAMRPFMQKQITPNVLQELRNALSDVVAAAFGKSNVIVSPEALKWLTNRYFMSIELNGTKVEEMIVINNFTLEELKTDDVRLLSDLFDTSFLGPTLKEEHQRRLS